MRRLCALQIIVLIAWFYTTRLSLLTYPGAMSVQIDGPFRTEADCKAERQVYQDMAEQFGLSVDIGLCFERKET